MRSTRSYWDRHPLNRDHGLPFKVDEARTTEVVVFLTVASGITATILWFVFLGPSRH